MPKLVKKTTPPTSRAHKEAIPNADPTPPSTPPSTPPPSPTAPEPSNIDPKQERLIHALYEAQLDLDELAQREGWSLQRLAQWATEQPTAQVLEGLCRLNDARAQMLVGRYRTLAAAKLFELASRDDGGELARKSCVDLLKVSLVALADHHESTSPAPVPLDDALARALMRRISASALEPSTKPAPIAAPSRARDDHRPPGDNDEDDQEVREPPAGDD